MSESDPAVPVSEEVSEESKTATASNSETNVEELPKTARPKTSEMVMNAIKTLKVRNGSSLYAIKKYISVAYGVDSNKLAPVIKKFLKSAVESGRLVQTKGQGASGSFKLPAKNTKNSSPTRKTSKNKAKTTASESSKKVIKKSKTSPEKVAGQESKKTSKKTETKPQKKIIPKPKPIKAAVKRMSKVKKADGPLKKAKIEKTKVPSKKKEKALKPELKETSPNKEKKQSSKKVKETAVKKSEASQKEVKNASPKKVAKPKSVKQPPKKVKNESTNN